jgi:ADP-heptose:LPS heptosyltransferase
MRWYYFIRNKIIIILTIIFSPIFFILAKMRRHDYGEAPRILVIPQLTRIGDLVCATPVFRAIKEKYPHSFLTVMVTGKIAGIIRNNPHIDQIVQFQTRGYADIPKIVRSLRFDVGISLTPQPIATTTILLGLIPERIKLVREERPMMESLTDWLNTQTSQYPHHTYLPQKYLDMLSAIGISGVSAKKDVFVSEEGEKKAASFLPLVEGEDKGGGLLIGISITAGNKIKEWGDDKFIELAQRILEKYKTTKIIFIGSKNDEPRINKLISFLPLREGEDKGGGVVVAADFSLEELPSLIKRLNLYIGVDTGPIYIAEALGTPLLDIIGPVDPAEQPPCSAPRSICVLPPTSIKPTSFVLRRPGKNHRAALEATSVEMVMAAAEKLISPTQR